MVKGPKLLAGILVAKSCVLKHMFHKFFSDSCQELTVNVTLVIHGDAAGMQVGDGVGLNHSTGRLVFR